MKHLLKHLLIDIDSTIPNLALMRLSAWLKHCGHSVELTRRVDGHADGLFGTIDKVWASKIFRGNVGNSDARYQSMLDSYPDAIVGGTGIDGGEDLSGWIPTHFYGLDYSIYPDCTYSLGFTQRGCTFKCPFCVVPKKEGDNRSVSTLEGLWRGGDHPRHIYLLDNDFTSQTQFEEVCEEALSGKFKVSISQGINMRVMTERKAWMLCRMWEEGLICNSDFSRKHLYTALDNGSAKKSFAAGFEMLERNGFSGSRCLTTYMLVGFSPREKLEDAVDRYLWLRDLSKAIRPYPMRYRPARGLATGRQLTNLAAIAIKGMALAMDKRAIIEACNA